MVGKVFDTIVGVITSIIGILLGYFCIVNSANVTPLRVILSVVMIPVGFIIVVKTWQNKKEKFY